MTQIMFIKFRVLSRFLFGCFLAAILSGCATKSPLGIDLEGKAVPVANVDKLLVGNSVVFGAKIGYSTQWGPMVPYPRTHAVLLLKNGDTVYPHKPGGKYTISASGFCFLKCFSVYHYDNEYFLKDEDGNYSRMIVEPDIGVISKAIREREKKELKGLLSQFSAMGQYFVALWEIDTRKCVRSSAIFGCIEYSDGYRPYGN